MIVSNYLAVSMRSKKGAQWSFWCLITKVDKLLWFWYIHLMYFIAMQWPISTQITTILSAWIPLNRPPIFTEPSSADIKRQLSLREIMLNSVTRVDRVGPLCGRVSPWRLAGATRRILRHHQFQTKWREMECRPISTALGYCVVYLGR